MNRFFRSSVATAIALLFAWQAASSSEYPVKNILVVVEGTSSLKNHAMGDGRQLAALLGHFSTAVTVQGANEYVPHSLEAFDYTFYIGFHPNNSVPAKFQDDIEHTDKPVIWMNTGFREFSAHPAIAAKYGFRVTRLDSSSRFDAVKAGHRTFTKGEPNLNIVELLPKSQASVLATASSSATRREQPYIVRSANLTYFADSPFASADPSDRYLLFADMLHDILNEQHEESHSALIRIEDVTPMENPDRLREIADILSSRNIPFLVSTVPFYVNPGEGIRVSLSDKPDIVDALKYMVQNGGTIVMHGVTHQYKGITASDFEFWDESTNGPIRGETPEGIARKLDLGIQEFMKNGLYPLVWETPHYTASFQLYQTVSKYFSTAMEQRLSIEDFDYSQFFPYLIQKDLFGQRIYPENLGYVPLDADRARSEASIKAIVKGAESGLAVRDGYASCFFHAFVDLDLLKELVETVQGLGYTYMDMREQPNWVKTKDRFIASGSQNFNLTLNDQYLVESTFDKDGELLSKNVSQERIKGLVSRDIVLQPGQFYRAEPTEFRERPLSFVENVMLNLNKLYRRVFPVEESWHEARTAILWNYHAKGAAYNDQASLAAVFRSVNLNVDTIFVGERIDPTRFNLIIVPLCFVDSLQPAEYDLLKKFVAEGGNLITDGKNDLAEDLGVKFSDTHLKISRVRDHFFPEEHITWRYAGLAAKFEAENLDEVFCSDEQTEAPLIAGLKYGRGKVIFCSTTFDPHSPLGYSQYPWLLDHVRSYFKIGPIVRRENLEVYFDPGFRRTMSVEQLVKQWVSQGIRIVHAAGWHQYPKYTWDYQRLITLAHANGILVYAWLEPPQVSQKFWQEHPEWREKNYKGEDVRPSWRYPVALTDRKCLEAVADEYRKFVEAYDWDGVNLAELYFEAAHGLEDPQFFTPMHPSAREGLRKKYGIDPAGIFTPSSSFYWKNNGWVKRAITEYRIAKLTEAYEVFLPMLAEQGRTKPGFQIIVTAMDSHGSPEMRDYVGVDMDAIMQLQKKYGFLLQAEDPENRWSTTPMRYVGMGKEYAALVGDSSKIMLDLNIGSFRKPDVVTPFPTLIQTGTESFLMVNAASIGAPRQTIYSESSINPQDLVFFPFALASEVRYRVIGGGYETTSPYSFVLKLPKEIGEIVLDGVPLSPARENMFLIPAGTHTVLLNEQVSNLSSNALQPRIMSITGTLKSVAYDMRTIAFSYESSTRTLVSINREPTRVIVDGEAWSATAMKGNDCYSIFLPPGHHNVELVAGDPFTYGVTVTSFWSTTAIAIFGSLAILMLLIMYLVLVVVRRRYRLNTSL